MSNPRNNEPKCGKCQGDLYSIIGEKDGNWKGSPYYYLEDKNWKVCESCWQQEEKKYRNHSWWGIAYIPRPQEYDSGTIGGQFLYDWNTQKWIEEILSKRGNPSSEIIEEDKEKIRQYLKDKGIQKVKHSGSFLTGLNIEYADGRKENNHSIDTPELNWISSYFSYLAEQRGIGDKDEKELLELFFGQETDSSNDNVPERERERQKSILNSATQIWDTAIRSYF